MSNISINNIVNSGFVFVKNKLSELKNEDLIRIAAVAFIALACLRGIYLAYLHFRDYVFNLNQQEYLAPSKLVSREEEEALVKGVEKKWLDDPQEELKRIKQANLIPYSVQQSYPTGIQSNQRTIVMGKVVELKNLYRPTHYVFTHGQDAGISVVNQVMKECVRIFTPQWYHPLKIPFRLPHTVKYSENVADFNTQYDTTQPTFMDDGYHSDKMISVDAQFCNQEKLESALHFFSRGTNIAFKSGNELRGLFKSTFLNYLPNESICIMLAEKAVNIANNKRANTQVGVLYAICIPKSLIQDQKKNFAYPSHPFGQACHCLSLNGRIRQLENMQNDKTVKCSGGRLTQYRILTSRLSEELDVRTFAVDALPKDKTKLYEQQLKDLVEELRLYSFLSDLYERVESEPEVLDLIDSLIISSPQLDPAYTKLLAVKK